MRKDQTSVDANARIIRLSVNPTVVSTKEEGGKITNFQTRGFDLDKPDAESELRQLLRSNVHSLNYWVGGISKAQQEEGFTGRSEKKNYQGVFGIALDYDDGKLTLEQARAQFRGYIHIIYTSSGHRQFKADHAGVQDRFRVILPFRLGYDGTALFGGKLSGKKLYDYLKATYPEADPRVFDMHMKLYPFAGPDPSLYELSWNPNGKWFSITLDDIKQLEEKQQAKSKSRKSSQPGKDIILIEDEILLPDRATTKLIGDVEDKQPCFCLFCDDISSQTASAFVGVNDHGEHYMYCSHCDKTYWSDNPRFKVGLVDLYFDHTAGHAAYFDKDKRELKYFKNQKDWLNFCRTGILNPAIETKLPRATTVFDPSDKHGLGGSRFNIFTPSKYLNAYDQKITPDLGILKSKAPRIMSVLENLFEDDDTINLFLNWAGFILQDRRKTTLSWIITTPAKGTGKEVLVSLILGPLFGAKQAQIEPASAMTDKFNCLDMTCWLRAYDEVFQKAALEKNIERREWLKTRIGSKHLVVEYKGIDKIMMESHMNFILLSNYSDSILLEKGDRRFNVVRNEKARPLHEMTWWQGGPAMENEIKSELEAFAEYVQSITTDYDKANYPTDNDARKHMLESSKEDMELVVDALKKGDSDFFELDDVFPRKDNYYTGTDYNQEARDICREAIKIHHAIPSTWMVQLLGRIFRGMSICQMRRKLKSFGAQDVILKINNKAYRVWQA